MAGRFLPPLRFPIVKGPIVPVQPPKMYHVCVLGTPSSGKSNIMDMLCGLPFSDSLINVEAIEATTATYLTTDGIVYVVYMSINEPEYIKMGAIPKSSCNVVLYDVSNPDDVGVLNQYLDILNSAKSDVPVIIVGNKVDLADTAEQSFDEIKCTSGTPIIKCSLKNGGASLMEELANKIVEIISPGTTLKKIKPQPFRMQEMRIRAKMHHDEALKTKSQMYIPPHLRPASSSGDNLG